MRRVNPVSYPSIVGFSIDLDELRLVQFAPGQEGAVWMTERDKVSAGLTPERPKAITVDSLMPTERLSRKPAAGDSSTCE